jgi:hypothetical protein
MLTHRGSFQPPGITSRRIQQKLEQQLEPEQKRQVVAGIHKECLCVTMRSFC